MTNGTTDVPASHSPTDRVLTPGEALVKFFMDNADKGANATNDDFVVELLRRRREIQSLANPSGALTPRQRGA